MFSYITPPRPGTGVPLEAVSLELGAAISVLRASSRRASPTTPPPHWLQSAQTKQYQIGRHAQIHFPHLKGRNNYLGS